MEYYHNLVTQKSFELLKKLQRDYRFILIGGWAVFLWTKAMKSKDIDLVVDFEELAKIRQNYEMVKNDRLKKYEIKVEEIDVDIYVHHYSNPGLPAEEIEKFAVSRGGFRVPRPEILLFLKQVAYGERRGKAKGEKDKIDILSLLTLGKFDLTFYQSTLAQFHQGAYLSQLKSLLSETIRAPELNLNEHEFSRVKKQILEVLDKLEQ